MGDFTAERYGMEQLYNEYAFEGCFEPYDS